MQRLIEAISYDIYKDQIDQELFNKIIAMDPTSDKKYSRWLLGIYLKEKKAGGQTDIFYYATQYPEHVTTLLKVYDLWKNKKVLPPEYSDIIKSFKSLNDLGFFVNRNKTDLNQEIKNLELKKSKDNIKVLFKDSKHILLMPLDYGSSYKYGIKYGQMNKDGHQGWCTTGEGQYDYYSKNGDLYINRKYLEDGKTLDPDWGAQLWIPSKNGKGKYVQCKDVENDDVDDLDDTIFDGIPRGVKSDIGDLVEEAGGIIVRSIMPSTPI